MYFDLITSFHASQSPTLYILYYATRVSAGHIDWKADEHEQYFDACKWDNTFDYDGARQTVIKMCCRMTLQIILTKILIHISLRKCSWSHKSPRSFFLASNCSMWNCSLRTRTNGTLEVSVEDGVLWREISPISMMSSVTSLRPTERKNWL